MQAKEERRGKAEKGRTDTAKEAEVTVTTYSESETEEDSAKKSSDVHRARQARMH